MLNIITIKGEWTWWEIQPNYSEYVSKVCQFKEEWVEPVYRYMCICI